MKVLLINNYDSFVFNLAQMVEEMDLCELSVVSYDEVDENVIDGFDKFIISPGPGIPKDFPNLQKFVKLYHSTKDILGVCLGHEAIALSFGGEIVHSGKVFHGFTKKSTILDHKNYIFKDIPDGFEAGCYHSWALKKENFPQELNITAIAEDGIIMALEHKQYNVVGFQYHPESIMTKHGKQMVLNWLSR